MTEFFAVIFRFFYLGSYCLCMASASQERVGSTLDTAPVQKLLNSVRNMHAYIRPVIVPLL